MLQAVPEFMEEGRDLIEAHQRRFSVHGRSLIADEVGDREAYTRIVARREANATPHAIVHPRSAPLLAGTRVGVEEEGGDFVARFISKPEEPDVGMPDVGLAVRGLDTNAKELLGQGKEAVEHFGQRKIRPQFLFVVRVILLAKSFGPIARIPMVEVVGFLGSPFGRDGPQGIEFHPRGLEGGGAKRLEQFGNGVDARGHLARKAEFRGGGKTEQRRFLGAQGEHALDQRSVVPLALPRLGLVGPVEFFAQISPLRVVEESDGTGRVESELPGTGLRAGARLPRFPGRLGTELPQAGRGARHFRGIAKPERPSPGGVENPVVELSGEASDFLLNRIESAALFALEAHSAMTRLSDQAFDDAFLGRTKLIPLCPSTQFFQGPVERKTLGLLERKAHDLGLDALEGGA